MQAKAGELEAKTGELAQLKGTYDKLEDKMKDEIAKGDIRLSQSGGRLRVDLVDKILFDSGEAVISKRGEGVLGRVGAVLATVEDKQIQVSGHTDSNPISEKLTTQFPSNWELSVARAVNVVRFLEEKAGVPPKTLLASGYGQHHPIASNKNAHGRARNRRIEILLTPSLDPKAIARSKLRLAEAEAKEKERDGERQRASEGERQAAREGERGAEGQRERSEGEALSAGLARRRRRRRPRSRRRRSLTAAGATPRHAHSGPCRCGRRTAGDASRRSASRTPARACPTTAARRGGGTRPRRR